MGDHWASGVWSHRGQECLQRLALERGNLTAVLQRALVAPRGASSARDVLRAVRALEPLFTMREPPARSFLGPSPDAVRSSLVALFRGHLHLAHARRAAARGDDATAIAEREAARNDLGAVTEATPEMLVPVASRSVEVRLAARVLRQALEVAEGPADALLVARDAGWFRAPGAALVDMGRRGTLRRLLKALLDQRLSAPGRPMLVAQICAETWPGESIDRRTATNRAYVAINGLRSLGLRGVLLRAEQGWLLDPTIAVYRALSRPDSSVSRGSALR
jgi:hypothetical protein